MKREIEELLASSLAEAPLLVLDTETTGLEPELGHRVVELAAVRLEGWQERGRLNYLLNPGRSIDPGASAVNGIRDADVRDAPPFAAIFPELQEMAEGAVLVAHNAAFDAGFLGMECHILQQCYPDQAIAGLNNPWLCTLRLARRLFYFDRNSLGHVARRMGVRTGRAHRAMNDVYTTVEVLKRMARELSGRRLVTVGDFLHAQGGPIYPPRPERFALPPLLAQAMNSGRRVCIVYHGPREQTRRVVTPRYVSKHQGQEYLIAFCHLRNDQRTFRLDRIVAMLPDDETG